MSLLASSVFEAHDKCGAPLGNDATFNEVAEWAGDKLLEVLYLLDSLKKTLEDE